MTAENILTPDILKALSDEQRQAVDALLEERASLETPGLLSGNTKRINAIIGPVTGETITLGTAKRTAPKLPATKSNLAKLTKERDSVPKWEPGKRASLTRQIKAMESELAK